MTFPRPPSIWTAAVEHIDGGRGTYRRRPWNGRQEPSPLQDRTALSPREDGTFSQGERISGDGSPYSMERQPRQRSGTDIYHAIKENRPADPYRCLLRQQWQLRTQSLPACRLHPFPIPHPHRLLRPADQHSAPLIEQLPHHHPRLRILHALLADKVKNVAICFFSTPIPINRLPFRGMGVDFPYLGVSFRLF